MALTTRCPQCGTSFKVVPDQLRVRNGLVRCGACATVFDGRACLLPETGAGMPAAAIPASNTPIAPPAPAASQAIAAPVLVTPPAPPVAAGAPPPVRRPSVEPREVAPWDDLPDESASPGIHPGASGASPAATPSVAPTDEPAPRPLASAVPPAVLRGRDDIRRRIEPDAALAEEGDDDEDENEDLDRYDDEPRLSHAPPRWPAPAAPRDEPIVAVRDSANHEAPRHARPAEPVFVVRDDARPTPPGDDDEIGLRHPDDDDQDADDRRDLDGAAEPILGDTRTRYSSATDVGRAPPEFLDQDRQERHGLLRKLWGYACLIGLLALGLQLLYVYRIDIANSVPVLRPALEAACKPLGCTVGYARRLERIAISSSSLQPPTGAAAIDDGRTRLVLNLVLRNRYDKPQHWPALVLDLTDLSDTVVVRRVLMPENYLTPEQLRGPFGPAGELKISVPIEVTGVQVNGYQLDKFFP
ncbi:DUF3426 domain-containing protein [Achromobacter xylosoxidans]|uniref:DUF3426 domain-containing protein n=1 Tax=Alcaligenes xylosoxydans xylosoxydans TaxID=85698 RepID=UPI0022B90CB3|nr:DUF3426 domain-containing protein [Achromobacter xylosoxidans]MCZ8388435.1 DUF3426 domain-containing protein [Achromobacter xylosoxidans]